MILEELTIRNWRSYREPHTFRFEEGFNLLVGRNEAGKSTLFEALTRVLFDRHRAAGQEIRDMQPLASTLGPEASLVIKVNGQRHKIVKRFLENATCELYTERQGQWERDAEGDEADNRLRGFLNGEAPGRTARAEHRGLAEALWFLQEDEAIPEREWSKAVSQGLQGLVSLTVHSPREKDLLDQVSMVYEQHWTPGGKLKAGSELVCLRESVSKLEATLEDLRNESRQIEEYQKELESLASQAADNDKALQDARMDLNTARQAVEAVSAVEEEGRDRKKNLEATNEALTRLQTDKKDIDARARQIEKYSADLDAARAQVEEHTVNARIEQRAAEGYRKEWQEELKPQLEQLEADLAAIEAAVEVRDLGEKRDLLKAQVKAISDVREAVAQAKQELNSLTAPTKTEMNQFRQARDQLNVVEGQIRVSGIQIGFTLDDQAAVVSASPEPAGKTDEGEYLIAAPTMFTIKGVGQVRVRGGGASLAELREEAESFQQQVRSTLEQFKCADLEAMEALFERRQALDREAKHLEKQLKAKIEEGEPSQDELNNLDRAIAANEAKAQGCSPEIQTLDTMTLRAELANLRKSRGDINAKLDTARENEHAATAAYEDGLKQAHAADTQAAQSSAKIKVLQEQNETVIANYGSLQNLASQIEQAARQVGELQAAWDTFMADYDLKVGVPRKAFEQAQQRVDVLDGQSVRLSKDMTDRQARIEQVTGGNLYSQIDDLEADLKCQRRQGEQLSRQADAAKLLHDLMAAHERQRGDVIAGPVVERMKTWLRVLTDDGYDSLELNHSLLPTAVHSRRYGVPMAISSLSYGTHEQIVVLLRLAIGVLLAGKQRNLVVIDDRLVNADLVRMSRLRLILQEAAADGCQILLATCNDTPYAGIGGKVIRVPTDGVLAQ